MYSVFIVQFAPTVFGENCENKEEKMPPMLS